MRFTKIGRVSILSLKRTFQNHTFQHVRLVAIQDIDEQACGGTHVRYTKEIGAFSIVNVKNKGDKIKRLEVVIQK
ncbi:hypothetical protein [Brevibacillus sp. H7]|uniref:hypothetical protein n=1 Tax=Brevibacillus sp. H7 TaxID=3349138 RepID=UPI0038020F1D